MTSHKWLDNKEDKNDNKKDIWKHKRKETKDDNNNQYRKQKETEIEQKGRLPTTWNKNNETKYIISTE